ncbi:MAG: hypothetical protein AB7O62_19490 [Pirellulales bacterium]
MPAFEELDDSPRFHITEYGTSAVRRFLVAWPQWQDFARQLVGSFQIIGGGYSFVLPSHLLLNNLIVSELTVDPWPADRITSGALFSLGSSPNDYPHALVTATYRTIYDHDNRPRPDLPDVPAGTILTYAADLGAEYITVPGRVWQWADPPDNPKLPDDVNPGLLLPSGAYRLVWRRVAQPPWTAIRSLRGKVNHASFVGAPAGTVLFLGAKVTREFQFLEEGGFWRVEYSFLESTRELSSGGSGGWNHFYKQQAVAGEHWVAIQDEDGNAPYRAGDLTALFQFE